MSEDPISENPKKSNNFGYLPFLLLLAILLGLYAQFLQQRLYLHQAPFFDSVQYYDRAYEIVSIRQQNGIMPAIENATQFSSTFCFPYYLAIILSYILPTTRAIGVWIEVFYLAVFLVSLAEYLRRVIRASSPQIILGVLPVFMMTAIYRSNSGLSDLRVDLPCAFLYGATACWWLIGRSQSDGNFSWKPFVTAGVCGGVACLTRAIAPIYLISGFIPLLAVELVFAKKKSALLLQAGMVAGVAAVLSGWFYIIQFKFIYYYYAVWNTDANASVSISRALKHFVATIKSIGPIVIAYLVLVVIILPKRGRYSDAKAPIRTDSDAMRMLWLGLAPVLFLIAKRADINPFVSLPGSIGIVLAGIFLIFPRVMLLSRLRQNAIGVVATTLVLVALAVGYHKHTTEESPTMMVHQQLIEILQQDAQATGRSHVVYSVNLISTISPSSLKSILQFDRKSQFVDRTTVSVDGIAYEVSGKLMNPSRANWDQIEGESSEEKIKWLGEFAQVHIDYVVTHDVKSVALLKKRYGNDYSMRYADSLISTFSNSQNWIAVSEWLEIEPGIHVQLMRNTSSNRMTMDSNKPNGIR